VYELPYETLESSGLVTALDWSYFTNLVSSLAPFACESSITAISRLIGRLPQIVFLVSVK